jgi:hypothetical protein
MPQQDIDTIETSSRMFLGVQWAGCSWTPWISLFDRGAIRQLPSGPGLYRIATIGTCSLAYIGQTSRGLRERVRALSLHGSASEMPFNDPHTAAPGIWCFRVEDAYDFEVSVALSDEGRRERLARECYAIWLYRLESGRSPGLNLGGFHLQYTRPRNRTHGVPGRRLEVSRVSTARADPLKLQGEPGSKQWMGLDWSPPGRTECAPALPGIDRAVDRGEVVYLGEASRLRQRLELHGRNYPHLTFSWARPTDVEHRTVRVEVENDLIAAFFAATGRAPQLQFSGSVPAPRS